MQWEVNKYLLQTKRLKEVHSNSVKVVKEQGNANKAEGIIRDEDKFLTKEIYQAKSPIFKVKR